MEHTMTKRRTVDEKPAAAGDGSAPLERQLRRHTRWGTTAVAVGLCGVLAASACSSSNDSDAGAAPGSTPGSTVAAGELAESPTPFPAPLLDRSDVDAAVGQIDGWVKTVMDESGVPGVAVAVVYQDEVVYEKGFGVRKVGEPEPVDTDTVFELASVSKPIASSVIAGPVGEGALAWDDLVAPNLPGFSTSDPWVTEHVTYQDLLSHQSGLPDHAGDLLEDLGYDFQTIIERQSQQPLDPFRANWAYTNMGFSAAGEAVASVEGTTWPDLADQVIFDPLGMDSSSYRFEDFESAENRAYGHVLTDPDAKTWEAKYVRDADQQAPAGGASSSVHDMTKWLRMELGAGELDGAPIVDAAALQVTHQAHYTNNPAKAPAARNSAYGLGWNVSVDNAGRAKLGHSGAFALGAGTNVTMLPGEGLGMVVLANGAANGVSETIVSQFFDYVENGRLTVDWWPFVSAQFEHLNNEGRSEVDYANPPAGAAAPQPASTYVGAYTSPYYGPMEITAEGEDLTLRIGKDLRLSYPMTHFEGDTYWFETSGENAVGPSGVTFTVTGGQASSVDIEYLDHTGLGTFSRS
jgi:CubicO group peptidase (beta-lactamase class C family)